MNKYCLIVGLLFVFSTSVIAEIQIYALEIPGLHQKDGGGEYDAILKKAIVEPGNANVKVVSPSRGMNLFSTCQNCCLTPANKNPDFYDFGDDVIATKPMSTAKVYIFTGKNQAVINNLDDLKGKKVGARSGMPYGKKVEGAGLKLFSTSNIENNIKKIDQERLDAFIAYTPDAYTVFEKLGVSPYPHDVDNPISVHPDALVCRGVSTDFVNMINSSVQ